jgi:adenine-specific DNA-methyltransferase
MSMMYPRLVLARNLLSEDGVIFISIDDNEVHNLKALADEIFGAANLVCQFVWAAGRKNNSRFVSVSHEYMLCYCKSIEVLSERVGEWRTRKDGLDEIYAEHRRLVKEIGPNYEKITAELKSWFRGLPDSDPSKRHDHYSVVDARGVYFPDNISAPGGGGPTYEVVHPKTKKPVAVPSRGWVISNPEKMAELIRDNRVHFGPDESFVPCSKAYLVDREFEVPYSVFYQDGRGATKRLRALLNGNYFGNPKDELVLQRITEFASGADSIILDFFAGSGTTGHAVLAQNAKDGGSRRFILVQLPEPVEEGSEAAKAGFETIADITKERVRRAAKEIAKEAGGASKLKLADGSGPQDLGFRVFRLDKSNFQVWDAAAPAGDVGKLQEQLAMQVEHVVKGRKGLDVVFEVLLKSKLPLTSKVEKLKLGAGEVWSVNGGVLLVVVDEGVDVAGVRELAKRNPKPETVVFLDRCFGGKDSLKANARKIFQDANIEFKTI